MYNLYICDYKLKNNNMNRIALIIIAIIISSCNANDKLYRIEFENTNTGYKGFGKWNDDIEVISDWVDFLNLEYPYMDHVISDTIVK